jgi:hypothetical protein
VDGVTAGISRQTLSAAESVDALGTEAIGIWVGLYQSRDHDIVAADANPTVRSIASILVRDAALCTTGPAIGMD